MPRMPGLPYYQHTALYPVIDLVLTCRPTFQPSWGFRAPLTPLTLTPLTRSQVEEMVQGVLRGHSLPVAVLAQIVAQTEGIPLFVEEMTKAVVEAGLSTAGPAKDAATGPLPTLAIPATLHEALMARLDRLGSAKGVAQLGATIGREFAYTLLRAVAPLEDEVLQRDLATLVAAELLYQRGPPPRAIYRFKHALIQDAAYESGLRSVRRQTHQRILQVLAAQFPEMVLTQPELLAYHAQCGEQWEQAVTYFRQAGEQALARSAHQEAVAAFEQAPGAIQHLPASHDTHAQAIDLRLALRHALGPLGELGRLFINYALALAEELGMRPLAAHCHRGLGMLYRRVGRAQQALASLRTAIELYRTMEMTFWLPQTEAALAQTGERHKR